MTQSDEESIILDAEEGPYDDETCPNCGEPFEKDEWEYTHGGDARGGSAWYVCPSCGEQTITVIY